MKLSDLQPDDVAKFDLAVDCAFVFGGDGRCHYPDGSSIRVNSQTEVFRIGRGRIVPAIPAHIEMDTIEETAP